MKTNPFRRSNLPSEGDRRAERLYLMVGKALSVWETTEEAFAHLFNVFVSPGKASFPSRRAYGSIATARGRKEMVWAAAEIFFRNFPDQPLEKETKEILNNYNDAGARRNELAHGVVAGHLVDSRAQFTGYYLGPSFWNTNKRGTYLEPEYLYNSQMIAELIYHYTLLRGKTFGLCQKIEAHFHALPGGIQQRY